MHSPLLPLAGRPGSRSKRMVPSVVHEAQVTTLINLAARLTGKAARKRMGSIGAWPGQIPLLLWLLEGRELIQKELVQRAGMEQSTVAEHLDRMERGGLIRRRRGTVDRRQFSFSLTEKGLGTATALLRSIESGARTFTRGIPKEDLQIFERVLRQIIEHLNAFIKQPLEGAGRDKRKLARLPKTSARRKAPRLTIKRRA